MTAVRISGLVIRERIYRTFILLLPRSFRDEFGQEIVDAFRDGYRDQFERLNIRAARRFARQSLLQLMTCAVRLHFGQRGRMQKQTRTSWQFLPNLARDVAVAIRGFAHKPGFFLTGVLTIGLGVGATTTVFSVVDKVLLRALPYPDVDRVVYFTNSSHSFPDFQDWRDRTEAFESLAAAQTVDYDWRVDGEPRRLRTALVTDGFFQLFGARTIVGQFFREAGGSGTQPVVLSHQLWQTHWGGDPQIIGRSLTINDVSVVVTGIMDPGFQIPAIVVGKTVDVWMPLDPTSEGYADRNIYLLDVAGRLAPSQTLETAQAQLTVMAETQAAEHGDRYLNEDGSVRAETIVSLYDAVTSDVSDTLMLLMGAVGFMLLIACANVANLFLARGTDRHREIILRIALGAGRPRITAQLLVEAVVLALAGGALGIAIAVLGVNAFAQLNPVDIPRIDTVSIDGRVLLFTLFVAILTGIFFGVLPALQGSRSDANEVLKGATGRSTAGRIGRNVREALVVTEIALSLILTAGAAVLFHSLLTAQRTDPGIDGQNVFSVPLALTGLRPDERLSFSNAVIDGLAAHSITASVGAGVTAPFDMVGGRCCWFMNFARPTAPNTEESAVVQPITAEYFSSLGATVTRGRDFTDRDRATAPFPAIINITMAGRMFGDNNPIGQTMLMGETPITVIGVVADIRHWGLQEAIGPEVYIPYNDAGRFFSRYNLLVQSNAPAATVANVIRTTVWSIRPNLPVESINPMAEQISESIADSRFYSILFGVFAAISLALAAAGVYGSMLYSVGQRYRELAVRLAVGAQPRDIIRLVLARGSMLTAGGVVLGLALAVVLVRSLEHLIVGVSALDIRTMVAAVGILVSVAVAACWLPARRASNTDPNVILRFE